MHPVLVFDLAFFLASLLGLVALLRGWKRAFQRGTKLVLVGLFASTLLYSLCLVLEWSGITTALDTLEDLVGALIPMWWAFVFYAFVQGMAGRDLRQSEARYRTLVENNPDMIARFDREYRRVYVNPAAERMLGVPPQAVLGKTLRELGVPAAQADRLEGFIRQVFEPRREVVFETAVPIEDEGTRHYLTRGVPELAEDGSVASALFIHRDITERVQAEEALRRLVGGTSSATGTVFFETLVRELAEWLGVRWALVTELEPGPPERAKPLAFWSDGRLEPIEAYDLGGTPCERASREGFCLFPAGLTAQFPQDPILDAWGAEWYAGVPLRDSKGHTVGILCALHDRAIEAPANIAEVFSIFSHRAGVEIVRKRAEEVLRESEERLELAIEGADLGLWDWDVRGNTVIFNQRWLEALGYSRVELEADAGKWAQLVHLEDLAEANAMWDEHTFGSHPVYEATYRVRTKDGKWRWVMQRGKVFEKDKAGHPLRALGTFLDITERRHAEEERERLLAQIQEQARQMQQIIDTVPEGVLLLGKDAQIVLANPAARRDLEALSDARVGDTLTALGEYPLSELLTWPEDRSWYEIKADGHTFEVIARPVQAMPQSAGWVLVIRDVTHEREMQERVRRQDRLAAIGQLAGGVAHDFNNLLTAIRGYTQFALDEILPGDPVHTDLEEVKTAADRAVGLTRQLLAFSRKQVLRPRILDLNTVITDIEKMLKRLIGEDIELNAFLDPSLEQVRADPGQIEQVIVNLCVNARDAMPQGGQLTLTTKNVVLDQVYAREHVDVEAGAYVMLAVSDTGIGMDEQVKAHLFEPFFTTKEEGKGTGLGLATVHGIVTQSGGHIEVYSEPGMGTTFKVYLPRMEERPEIVRRERPLGALPTGTETILLAEDEETVRGLACRVLERQGYTVLTASYPDEVLDLNARHAGHIHLLITDVIMPGMGGPDLAARVTELRPEIGVLYISGYTDDAIARHGVLEPGIAFLGKPFTPAALAHKVREVLDRLPE